MLTPKPIKKLSLETKFKGFDKTVSDFWQWGYSDLLQNTTRGILAEYIVAVLLDIDEKPRNPWDAYDLELPNGKTIEIKTMSKLQAWAQKELTEPKVVLQPKRKWDPLTGVMENEPSLNADIYIICYFTADNHETADVMNLQQWEFYVLPKKQIKELLENRKSISLKLLTSIDIKPVQADNLKETIARI